MLTITSSFENLPNISKYQKPWFIQFLHHNYRL